MSSPTAASTADTVSSEPTQETLSAATTPSRVDRRGRLLVLLQFTLMACVVNSLSLQLPGTMPFLVGNMAAVAVALRFGSMLSLPVALFATGITGHLEWTLLAVLECLRIAHLAPRRLDTFALWWRVWLPLAPIVIWIALPSGANDPMQWALGTAVVLATGATSLLGGQQLARVTRSRRQMAAQPMSMQLSVQLATLMAAPATVVIALLLQAGHQQDLQRNAVLLDGRAKQLASQTSVQLIAHRDAVALAAQFLRGDNVDDTLARLLFNQSPLISSLATDGQGRILASMRPGQAAEPSGNDVRDRSYFRDTMALGEPTVSSAFRGRGIGNDIIVAVAAPWTTAEGAIGGVLQGSLGPNHLARELREQLDAEHLRYRVVDARGQVVFSSLADQPPLSLPDSGAGFEPLAQLWWAAAVFPAPMLRIDAAESNLTVQHEDPSLGWQAAALAPLRPLERIQTARSLAAALLVLLMITGLGWIASRFAERHSRGLAGVVARLRDLDLASGAHGLRGTIEATSSELAELVRDFERAEDRLHELHGALQASLAHQAALNRELEDRVAQRTAELSEALTRAEHFAAAKSGFLANMSHELRTPLAAILGYSEQGMRDGAPTSEVRRCLQTVVRNGRHLLEIVNDVLDASKIEAGQLRVQSLPVAPLAPVADSVELLRQRAAEKGLELVLSAHWPLPATVQADPLRLKQVVLNLISNAIKFTSHGFVVVRVRADAERGRWSVEVEDTGIGMSEDQCERVFQRFEQADDSTTRRFGGTGLGLYISRQLARQMDGDLTASSIPGTGSRFLLDLPIGLEAEWVEDGDTMPREVDVAAPAMTRLRGTVLVVDDVEDLRLLLRSRVAAFGADVREASNGLEACEAIAKSMPDLVLMDMHMPVLDGRAAVARLRAEGYTLPIYACSADVLPDDVARFIAIGCDGALGKPLDEAALAAVLTRHLASAETTAETTAEITVEAPAVADPVAAAMAAVRARFVAGVPGERAALSDAIARADHEALRQQVHRLKGSAGTFGFMEVSAAAAAVERAVRDDPPSAPERLAQLDALLAGLS